MRDASGSNDWEILKGVFLLVFCHISVVLLVFLGLPFVLSLVLRYVFSLECKVSNLCGYVMLGAWYWGIVLFSFWQLLYVIPTIGSLHINTIAINHWVVFAVCFHLVDGLISWRSDHGYAQVSLDCRALFINFTQDLVECVEDRLELRSLLIN